MKNNSYFLKQISESSNYFNDWLYNNKLNSAGGSSFYCRLFDLFHDYHFEQEGKTSHNCIGCNLEEGARNIELFFKYNNQVESVKYFLTLYTLLFYLQAERLAVIYKEAGIIIYDGKFDWSKFPVLQRIKYWANFFKHPKFYMLLHHPIFYIDGDPDVPNFLINGIIDDEFIHKFYKSDKQNAELKLLLGNKDNFIVLFPNMLELTKSLCIEFESIIHVIEGNSELISKLSELTSLSSE